jgi:hypothetical protein
VLDSSSCYWQGCGQGAVSALEGFVGGRRACTSFEKLIALLRVLVVSAGCLLVGERLFETAVCVVLEVRGCRLGVRRCSWHETSVTAMVKGIMGCSSVAWLL